MIPTSANIIFTLFDISLLVVVPLSRVIYLLSGCSIILSMYTNLKIREIMIPPPRTIFSIITNNYQSMRLSLLSVFPLSLVSLLWMRIGKETDS